MNGTSTNYICEENNRNLIESGVPLMRRNQEPRINFQCWQTNTIRIYWVSLSLFFRVRKFRYNPVFRWRSLNWYQILSLPTPAIVFVSTGLVKFGGRVSDNLTLNISWLKKKTCNANAAFPHIPSVENRWFFGQVNFHDYLSLCYLSESTADRVNFVWSESSTVGFQGLAILRST